MGPLRFRSSELEADTRSEAKVVQVVDDTGDRLGAKVRIAPLRNPASNGGSDAKSAIKDAGHRLSCAAEGVGQVGILKLIVAKEPLDLVPIGQGLSG